MKSFNRANILTLQTRIKKELKAIEDEYDVEFSLDGGNFTLYKATLKMEAKIITKEAVEADTDFIDSKCKMYGIKKRHFIINTGQQMEITQFLPRGRKYKFLAKNVKNEKEVYKFSPESILEYIRREQGSKSVQKIKATSLLEEIE